MNDIEELVHTEINSGIVKPSSTPASSPTSTRFPRSTQAAGEFLSFRLGTEEYGIEILRVQEIRSYEAVGADRKLSHF